MGLAAARSLWISRGLCPFKPKVAPLWENPFLWPFHPAHTSARHLTDTPLYTPAGRSPSQGTSSGVPVLESPCPWALPCLAAVTWPFSRSLSAAPASPPQSNDAIAAVSALAPGTCCHPRAGQRRLGSAANGQAPGPAYASGPPVVRRSAQARAQHGAGGGIAVRGAAVRDSRELSVWPAGHPHSRKNLGTEKAPIVRCRLSCGCLPPLPDSSSCTSQGVRLHRTVEGQMALTRGSERKQIQVQTPVSIPNICDILIFLGRGLFLKQTVLPLPMTNIA